MDMKLSAEMAVARRVVDALREAGIHEDDPDFATLLENESEAPDLFRAILRSARMDGANAKAAREVAKQIIERAQRLEAREQSKRDVVFNGMCDLDMKRLDAPDFTATVSAGQPSVEILDLASLPRRFVRVKEEADKAAIAAALKDGEAVEGAVLGNAKPTLTVRVK